MQARRVARARLYHVVFRSSLVSCHGTLGHLQRHCISGLPWTTPCCIFLSLVCVFQQGWRTVSHLIPSDPIPSRPATSLWALDFVPRYRSWLEYSYLCRHVLSFQVRRGNTSHSLNGHWSLITGQPPAACLSSPRPAPLIGPRAVALSAAVAVLAESRRPALYVDYASKLPLPSPFLFPRLTSSLWETDTRGQPPDHRPIPCIPTQATALLRTSFVPR